jgi:hypothetical protein
MDNYEVHEQNGDYRFGVVFLFDNYNNSSFKKDLQEIKDYQNHKGFSEDKEERSRELDLKFYNQKVPEVEYEFFKQKSFEIFSKFFFYMMKNNKSLATSTEFNIQFKITRIPNREVYFYYDTDKFPSDAENACFIVSGSWLLHTIVLPSIFGKSDLALIQRYMLHELIHHHDEINHNLKWLEQYEAKIRKLYIKKSAYFLNCLYTSLFNLREEGLADFNARKESPMIDLNMKGVRAYNANMLKLSKLIKREESEPFYFNEISTGNLTPSNEYTMGRNMCLTIAIAIAKKLNKPFFVVINGQKISSKEIHLNELLSEDRLLYISDIDKQVFTETINQIRPLAHYLFVKEYEKACDELGIKDANRIMTRRRFYKIIIDAITRLKKEKTARLKSCGYKYVEPEIKDL